MLLLDAIVCDWSRGVSDTVLAGWSFTSTDFYVVHQQQTDCSTQIRFSHGLCTVCCLTLIALYASLP